MYPKVMSEFFRLRNTPCYNLRQILQFSTDPIHSVYNGIEAASYFMPKIWEQIPAETKDKESLDGFKREIKNWKPAECPCRICRTFVPKLDFI